MKVNAQHLNLLSVLLLCGALSNDCLADRLPAVSKGKLERVKPFTSERYRDRHINIWLPPGYSTKTEYDALYMHDGDALFDASVNWNKQEWRVDEVAGELIENGELRPFIVVAIPNAGALRHSEYFPQKPFESLEESARAQLMTMKRGTSVPLFNTNIFSDEYARFIVKEVIPFVEANYPVYPDAQSRYLAGSSMGGLISWYTLMEYPDKFGGAICMSTHWPGDMTGASQAFSGFRKYFEQNLRKLSDQKLYFDHGDMGLDQLYPPLQQSIDQILKEQNYPVKLWTSQSFSGSTHNENSWARRLHIPLLFAFGKAAN